MSLVPKNHWQLTRPQYERGLLSGLYNNTWPDNLDIEAIENPTFEDLEPLMDKVSEKWGWKDQERYSEELLKEKLSRKGTLIYLLIDKHDKEDPVIGYALVSVVQKPLKDRFWSAANDTRVLEIDNLGLFPNKEGGGRGKAYFEMIFAKHFANNDIVYWSQHETHAPTLTRFYREKMNMEHLAKDFVPDWRRHGAKVA